MSATRRRPSIGIGLLLLLVALPPVTGLTWLSAQSLSAASEQTREASAIEADAEQVAAELRLISNLTVEYYWASSILAVATIGVDPGIVEDAVGLDMTTQYLTAQTVVDATDVAADAIGDDAAALAELRRSVLELGTDMEDVAGVYRTIRRDLETDVRAGIDDLVRRTIGAPNAEEMVSAVLALETAGALRADMSNIAVGYFAVRFPSWLTVIDELEGFVDGVATYETNLERLSQLSGGDGAVAEALTAFEGDERLQRFLHLADDLLRDLFENGVEPDPSARLTAVLADPEAEANAFIDSIYAVERHLDLVDAASVDVATAGRLVRSDAEATRDRTMWMAIALAAGSGLAVVVMASVIIRPLRRMAGVAEAWHEGHLNQTVPIQGPTETRTAARAMNEAVGQLRLAEKQAMALAEEDLDNPVLSEKVPGRLGDSLDRAVSHLTASLSEREEFQRRLAHEASHDGLTGLPNRSAAMRHLSQALARTGRTDVDMAVLFMDLDGFKQINDVHGHAAGDHVLKQVAKRLVTLTREGDSVARLGGDEFLVIAEPVAGAQDALHLGERILEAISRPTTFGTVELRPAASIGIALAGSSDLTADEMIRDADLAVYKAKAEGRGRLALCDEDLRDRLAGWADLETALRTGIREGELVVHYQAVVDAQDGRHVSLEALVRWNRPGHGLVEPNDFIPVAERSDLIVNVDRWVIREVAAQLAAWSEHEILGELDVAVNLSARHLTAPSLVDDVLQPLREHGVSPGRIVLEITETALLQDLDTVAGRLQLLRDQGVRVAIDDFGTGYTSLAHLRRLPVDVLKIDQSFTANISDGEERSLVKLIVDTGHLLGVSVTAEGVETGEQAEDLVALGSDALQGFRFSRPVPAAEIESALLAQPQ